MGGRRLTFLLFGCCFLLTCQAGGPAITQQTAADSAPSFELPGDFDWQAADAARRAFAEVGRVDSIAARLAVTTEKTRDGRTLVQVDRVVIGEDAGLNSLFQREGLSARIRGESLVIDADGSDGPRAAVRHVLRDVNDAIERVRSNVIAQRRVGHRAVIGSLETRIVEPEARDVPSIVFDMSQGPLVQTDQPFDVAIYGRGFFTIELPGEETKRYTRDGRFVRSARGALALRGWPEAVVSPRLNIPPDARSLEIKPDGSVLAQRQESDRMEPLGRIALAGFEHPDRLALDIDGLFVAGAQAGKLEESQPTEGEFGELIQGRLELSNVDAGRAWAQLCRLEDSRQILLAMIARLDDDVPAKGVASGLGEFRGRHVHGDPTSADTVVIPYADPPIGRRESGLVEFFQSRGIGYSQQAEGVEVRKGEMEAAVLSEYLAALRGRMDDLARTLASESDAHPTVQSPESSEVSLELHMAEADSLAAEYDQIKSALGTFGEKAVASLVRMLGASPSAVRTDAAWILGRMGSAAKSAVPALVDSLASADGLLRSTAAASLLRIAPGSRPVMDSIVDMWIAALHSPVRSERYHAAIALSRLGESAASAVPVLAAQVDDPAGGAALALGRIGPAAAPAVPALTEALSHPMPFVRFRAAEALGRIGPASRPALPILVTLFGDQESDVRMAAVEAVGSIGSDDSVHLDALAAMLKGGDRGVRDAATEALARLAPTNERARELLFAQSEATTKGAEGSKENEKTSAWSGLIKNFMARADVTSRLMLCDAIGALGPLGKPAIGILQELARDNRECVVCSALDAMGSLGAEARGAVSDLALMLRHDNPLVRARAAAALGSIGEPAAVAVPMLCACLDDDNESVVVAAVEALGCIGPSAADCIPLLRSLDEHESLRIREAACQTLNRIHTEGALTRAGESVSKRAVAAERSEGDDP